jgi:hypothetical protein
MRSRTPRHQLWGPEKGERRDRQNIDSLLVSVDTGGMALTTAPGTCGEQGDINLTWRQIIRGGVTGCRRLREPFARF